ncbi:MAG: Gfo/Idh/MocA family oxidoreductase [Candidatus Omnitrophica bacterium]|nr:Gfo/Idh/MocA family oxidoreductase [Candidatus Omnitrophota bacterium]
MPLKVGVVGVGHLGKVHARIYGELPDAELVGICDRSGLKKEIADNLRIPFYTDYRELLGKIDAVSIATPTSTHYEIAKEFLKAGVHTLIEKPVTLRLEEADELIEISRKKNCALQVGHLERHNPGFKRIEEIANNIRFFEIHRLGPFNPRINDCGVVLDLMIHDLDIVQNLVKSKVASFDAVGIPVLTPFEDIANVRIKFENNAVANLTASRLTPEKQRKIRIFQEDAYISLDYEAQSYKIFRKKGSAITQEKIEMEKKEPLKEEIQFFLSSIASGKGLGKPDQAARDALAFALEIVAAIKKIKLPELILPNTNRSP